MENCSVGNSLGMLRVPVKTCCTKELVCVCDLFMYIELVLCV